MPIPAGMITTGSMAGRPGGTARSGPAPATTPAMTEVHNPGVLPARRSTPEPPTSSSCLIILTLLIINYLVVRIFVFNL